MILFLACVAIKHNISLGLLIGYAFLVIATTILRREPGEQASVILTPFWSYKETFLNSFMWFEVRANILLFIPIGFLLPLNAKKKPLLLGILFSVVIEFIQLITHRGTCETDDLISNTIGLLIGFIIVTIVRILLHLFLKLLKK